MKQFIEFGAVWIGTVIHNIAAEIDFEVLSLPGGSLIAVLLWIYASAMNSIRRAAGNRAACATAQTLRPFIVDALVTRCRVVRIGGSQ